LSLDLNKVAPQIGQMIGRMRSGVAQRQERLSGALDMMHQASANLEALKKKIEESKTTWLVAGLDDSIDRRHSPPPIPADFTVLATDGSHIEVDRHQVVRCFLLNISHVVLRYGSEPQAVLESVPHLYAGDQDLVMLPPGGRGREQLIEGNLLGAKRSVEECRHLAGLAASLSGETPSLALLDGTLMLWGLEPYPDFVTEELLDKGLVREFDRLLRAGQGRKLAFGSYISAPRSTDVVNALRVAVCPLEAPDCDHCPGEGKRDCDWLAGFVDSQLFYDLLVPGERSDVFSSRSKVVKDHYLEHAINFFYLRLDDEVARVEMPHWVADDKELLELTHCLVLDQCRRGQGYPVALSEAHEQAVVTVADRQNFWALVEAGLVDESLPTPTTGKSRSKRTRWV
jgi:hypothetical protein